MQAQPYSCSRLLIRLQPYDIQGFYGWTLKSGRKDGKGGLSARTVHHFHRVLYESLKYAVKQELLIRNPAEAVDPPRPSDREMTALNAEVVRRFLEAAEKTPYYVIFYTAVFTGLRRSELLGLRWEDVDVDLARPLGGPDAAPAEESRLRVQTAQE